MDKQTRRGRMYKVDNNLERKENHLRESVQLGETSNKQLSKRRGESQIRKANKRNCVPAIRNRSPDTCWVRLSSQKNPTAATMLPHSITAAAMPKNPAVMRRRSEHRRKTQCFHDYRPLSQQRHTAMGNTLSLRTFHCAYESMQSFGVADCRY